MSWRELDDGKETGVREDVIVEDDGSFTIRSTQRTKPILEFNKERANDGLNVTKDLSFHHVGSIPMTVLMQWMEQDKVNLLRLPGPELGRYIVRKLKDPDNWHLKTTGARRL